MDKNIAIAFVRINDTDSRHFDLINIIKVSLMLIDIAQDEDPPNGVILIFDGRGVSFSPSIYVL